MRSAHGDIKAFVAEDRLTAAYMIVAHSALFLGVSLGFLQALEYAGIDLYPRVSFLIKSYYHWLSLHGVLNVLVWTTFFISGFLTFVTVQGLATPLQGIGLGWTGFGLMAGELILAAVPLLDNQATVMFTFYPPMKAHGAFYLGLTLVVAATWLVALTLYRTYGAWRRTHPGEWTPLAAFMSLVTFAVFFPSLLTFFNVVASLENGARARGGQGWVIWFTKLP
jgi:cytochrome c oxidase subunit 1